MNREPAARAAVPPALPAPTTVSEVVSHLQGVCEQAPPGDPALPFASMYLRMTKAIADALADGTFTDAEYVSRLDVVFAEYFLGARSGRRPAPRCWRVLFDAGEPSAHGFRHALAGMNAHINFDLALSVLDTCQERGTDPEDDSRLHRDYLAVNGVIAATFDAVKGELVGGTLAAADRALGEVDDAAGIWSIERARDAAWVRAQLLYQVRSLPTLQRAYVASHDRAVALIGRALLALPDLPG